MSQYSFKLQSVSSIPKIHASHRLRPNNETPFEDLDLCELQADVPDESSKTPMDDKTNTGTNFGNLAKLHKNKQKSESKLLTIPRDNSPNRSFNSGSDFGEEEDKSHLSPDEVEQDSNHVVLPFEVLIEQHH